MDESSTNYYLSIVYDPKTMHYDHRLQSLAMVYAPYISMVKTIVILNHVLQSSMVVYGRISPTISSFIVANDLRNPRPGMARFYYEFYSENTLFVCLKTVNASTVRLPFKNRKSSA